MDAISLLKDDHRTVERLFKRFEKTSDNATVERRRIVDEIIRELSIHAEIEETVFYPAIRELVPPSEDMVLESLEEHHVVKWVLSELEGMSPDAERFEAKVTVLIENVRHHVEEEESDLFPKVRRGLSRRALNEMGEAMERAKTVAPTRPHPRSPDTPPGNIVTGVVAAALDRAREAGQELVQNATGAARRTEQRAAEEARAGAATATRTAKEAAGSARRSAKKTTRKAVRSTKATTRKAAGAGKRATKKATGTAKKATRTAKSTGRKAASRTTTARKTAARKTAARKTAARKTTARKTAARKTTARKTTARKTTARKTAPRKTTARKTTARKTTARKTTGRPRKAAKKRS